MGEGERNSFEHYFCSIMLHLPYILRSQMQWCTNTPLFRSNVVYLNALFLILPMWIVIVSQVYSHEMNFKMESKKLK